MADGANRTPGTATDRPTATGADRGARTALTEERTAVRSSRPVDVRRTTTNSLRDRIRWGPVWAGLIVTLATVILLQLALIGSGAYEADFAEGVNEGALLSGLVALIAFFLGGLVAGASAFWRDVVNGALHGIVVWGLAVVGLILLSIVGGGFAAGAVGNVAEQFDIDQEQVEQDLEEFDFEQAGEDAQEAAAISLLALSLALAATVGGGIAGAKMWPTTREDLGVDLGVETDDDVDTRATR
jgi:hypothetical protein